MQFDVRLVTTICADRSRVSRLVLTSAVGRLLPFAVWILNQFERPLLVRAAGQNAPIRDSPTE